MSLFNYKAMGRFGEKVSGAIDASSREQANQCLVENGLIVEKITVVRNRQSLEDLLARYTPIKNNVLVYFSRQLATMIEANISLPVALDILIQTESNVKFKAILQEVRSDTEQGMPLADAMAGHAAFKDFDTVAIGHGQNNNQLDHALKANAQQLEEKLLGCSISSDNASSGRQRFRFGR